MGFTAQLALYHTRHAAAKKRPAGSRPAAAPDPANSKSIKTFINFINDVLIAATIATIFP